MKAFEVNRKQTKKQTNKQDEIYCRDEIYTWRRDILQREKKSLLVWCVLD